MGTFIDRFRPEREPKRMITAQERFSFPEAGSAEEIEARGFLPTVVDYDLPLAEMIERGGYDEVLGREKLTEEFFPNGDYAGDVTVGLTVVTLQRWEGIEWGTWGGSATIDEAIKDIRAQGFEAANIRELLAFGAQHPDWQREMTIVSTEDFSIETDPRVPPHGIGGRVNPIRTRVPILSCEGDRRMLRWLHDDDGFFQEARFLARETRSRTESTRLWDAIQADPDRPVAEHLAELLESNDLVRLRERAPELLDRLLIGELYQISQRDEALYQSVWDEMQPVLRELYPEVRARRRVKPTLADKILRLA